MKALDLTRHQPSTTKLLTICLFAMIQVETFKLIELWIKLLIRTFYQLQQNLDLFMILT